MNMAINAFVTRNKKNVVGSRRRRRIGIFIVRRLPLAVVRRSALAKLGIKSLQFSYFFYGQKWSTSVRAHFNAVTIKFVNRNSVKTLWWSVVFSFQCSPCAIYVIASCFGYSIAAVCPFHYRCRLSRKLDQLQILRDYFTK